jgi:hypothetical protein
MWWNTVFNMVIIAYCVAFKDGTIASLAVEACFWSNTATLLFYVFGATTQDILALRSGVSSGTITESTKSVQVVSSGGGGDSLDGGDMVVQRGAGKGKPNRNG